MEKKEKIAKCPYCGSTKLTKIDWGFANWECETCRNNFKTPYYPKEETYKPYQPREKTIGDYLESFGEYLCAGAFVLMFLIGIGFLLFRIYEAIILPLFNLL
ncbi:MAG: hypothetical protein IKV87_07685 [Methanobrevibacter sp.]|nr:hypothetical protein [Methanobrevibacter sp.]